MKAGKLRELLCALRDEDEVVLHNGSEHDPAYRDIEVVQRVDFAEGQPVRTPDGHEVWLLGMGETDIEETDEGDIFILPS